MVTHKKKGFMMKRASKLFARVNGSFKIIKNIKEISYELKLPDDYDSSPIFNVRDLRSYHGKDLKASLLYQLWN